MADIVNTVIALRSSGNTGNVPSVGTLANGELTLNYADGILYYKTVSNTLGSIRTTQPSGLNKEIQFNDSGTFGGNSRLTFNKSDGLLTAGNLTSNIATVNNYILFGDGSRQYSAANTNNLTVSLIDTSGNVSNVVSNVSALRFDVDSGFNVDALSQGIVKVGINSTFKYWKVNGTTYLTAQGLDTVNFLPTNGITITANGNASPQSITFDGSSIFDKTNAAYQAANSAGVYANAAFAVANSGGSATDSWARSAANSASSYANSAYAQANTGSPDSWARSAANSASSYANGAFVAANTADQKGVSAGSYANSAFGIANSSSSYANSAFSKANNALANTTGTFGGSLTIAGNLTANVLAVTSISTTGNSGIISGINIIYSNTFLANGGIVFSDGSTQNTAVSNSAGVYANAAFTQANTANTNAISAGSYANSAYAAANSGGTSASYANGAFQAANSASSYANSAFLTANASANFITLGTANSAASYANSAFTAANTANTNAISAGVYANAAFAAANSGSGGASGSYANSAYQAANSAGVYANAAFAAANSGGSGTDSWARSASNSASSYANSAYAQANTIAPISITVDSFTGNGAQTVYSLTTTPSSLNYTLVSVGGLFQPKTTYSVLGSVLTFTSAPGNNAPIEVSTIFAGSGVSRVGNSNIVESKFTGNGSNTTFTLSEAATQNNVLVIVNGLLQPNDAYTIVGTNTTITLSEAPAASDNVYVKAISVVTQDILSPFMLMGA